MVKQIIKQIVAILVGLGFVVSIFLFMPKATNNNLISLSILVPQNSVKNNSLFQYANGSAIISSIQPSAIASVIQSTNATSLLSLAEYLLSNAPNITFFNVSGGQISCVNSTSFIHILCNNATAGYGWYLAESINGGQYSHINTPLSSIQLNQILNPEEYFVLLYSGGSGNVNQSTPPPPL